MAEKVYRIEYDRGVCIGAAACAAVASEFWKMCDDGKADLIGFKLEDGKQVLRVKESQLTESGKKALELNKEAAEVCPVRAIHVYDDATNEKII